MERLCSARGMYARLNKLLLEVPKEEAKMALPAPDGEITVDNLVVSAPGREILF